MTSTAPISQPLTPPTSGGDVAASSPHNSNNDTSADNNLSVNLTGGVRNANCSGDSAIESGSGTSGGNMDCHNDDSAVAGHRAAMDAMQGVGSEKDSPVQTSNDCGLKSPTWDQANRSAIERVLAFASLRTRANAAAPGGMTMSSPLPMAMTSSTSGAHAGQVVSQQHNMGVPFSAAPLLAAAFQNPMAFAAAAAGFPGHQLFGGGAPMMPPHTAAAAAPLPLAADERATSSFDDDDEDESGVAEPNRRLALSNSVTPLSGSGGAPEDLSMGHGGAKGAPGAHSDATGAASNPPNWSYEEQFKQLYELNSDPKRKAWLDDWLSFMHKIGKPVTRIPIMAKQVLDLYELYRLVVGHGGLVEIIKKKLWREITKGLNLPSSITSAAFTLRTQYQKYLYDYECQREGLSALSELQKAIDENRREGRRQASSASAQSGPSQGGANGAAVNEAAGPAGLSGPFTSPSSSNQLAGGAPQLAHMGGPLHNAQGPGAFGPMPSGFMAAVAAAAQKHHQAMFKDEETLNLANSTSLPNPFASAFRDQSSFNSFTQRAALEALQKRAASTLKSSASGDMQRAASSGASPLGADSSHAHTGHENGRQSAHAHNHEHDNGGDEHAEDMSTTPPAKRVKMEPGGNSLSTMPMPPFGANPFGGQAPSMLGAPNPATLAALGNLLGAGSGNPAAAAAAAAIINTAHIKMTSRGNEPTSLPSLSAASNSSSDQSMVVSMEINGIMYQGVLFALNSASAQNQSAGSMPNVNGTIGVVPRLGQSSASDVGAQQAVGVQGGP